MTKRIFDVVVAAIGLIVAAPVLAVAALAVRLETPGPVVFRQERIGRNLRPFRIYKLRTMTHATAGPDLTPVDDARVTRVGRVLRSTKLDEVPQLVNVLKGEMSLVGPRPEMPRYVDRFRDDFAEILRLRPGITGMASVRYRNEGDLLATSDDPERAYLEDILPAKLRLEKQYLRERSLWLDVRLVLATVFGGPGPASGGEGSPG